MKLLDSTLPPPTGSAGALFGLAVASNGEGVDFVDDDTNTLNLLHQGSGCEAQGRRSPGLTQLLGAPPIVKSSAAIATWLQQTSQMSDVAIDPAAVLSTVRPAGPGAGARTPCRATPARAA